MDENIIITSHHESGHALMAYIVGWSIDSIILKIENEKLLYGVTNYDFCGETTDDWTNLNRRVHCLVGGPISQAFYENNNRIDLDMLGQDGITIDYLLSSFDSRTKEDTIQNAITTTATLLQISENRKAKIMITEFLMQNHKISQTEFIEIVKSCNVVRIKFN